MEVLNPLRVSHAYNYTHGLRTCNGKVYGKLDVQQNGRLNHGNALTM